MTYRHSADGPKPISAQSPRYSIWTVLRTMAVLALGYILLLAYLHYQGNADLRRIFGGVNGLATLKHADRIEAYRIKTPDNGINWNDASLLSFPTLNGPVSVSQIDAQTLVATLTDRNSYYWNARNGCIPVPAVRLDFVRGNDRLSVLLCFECDMLENFYNDKFVGGQNFDNVRPTLVQIVHKLFPDDPRIQLLAEQHSWSPPGK
jgi:hypothetical protein